VTFALADGNTDPQGIADPPTATPGNSGATALARTSETTADTATKVTLKSRPPAFIVSNRPRTSGAAVLPTSAEGRQVALTLAGDEDLALLAVDLIHSGRKRTRTSIPS
jgi:hypothetical protein